MGYPEDRTHGNDSAVDDEMIPANMTAQADASQQIPGSEAIPAGMPNAPHGDLPLEYDLQTFNALVAANTAMQTEISSLNERIGLVEQQRDSFKESATEARADAQAYLMQIKDLQSADRDSRKRLEEMQSDLTFARDQQAFAEKRLERALGYLDATLDRDDSLEAPATQTVPAARPTRGPNLESMARPVRRDALGRNNTDFAFGTHVEALMPRQSRRRYS